MRTHGEVLFVERLKVRVQFAREYTFMPEAGEPDMKPAKSRKQINESHGRLSGSSERGSRRWRRRARGLGGCPSPKCE